MGNDDLPFAGLVLTPLRLGNMGSRRHLKGNLQRALMAMTPYVLVI